ncbi:hypothetical protein MKW98_030683 [Papaver atlanticum]|uniref:PRA1 family protein n=1 Tax=Papaver atlanticum TaxID=357466 RepID=A0AAD4RUP6_9MAGN|nr:hypothetical protein MKW98_030683 [Papaver atlanticum]
MTTYGTIPSGSGSMEFISRAKEQIYSGLGTRRPWRQMFLWEAFGAPHGLMEAYSRIKTNTAYFRMNYAIIVLVILFLSLIYHPISMIIFIAIVAAWVFLYFLRDQPLVLFNNMINDGIVLTVLAVVTIVGLMFTGVILNVFSSVAIGAVIVLAHGALRKTDDLFVDDEEAPASGLPHKRHSSSSSG